MKVLSETIDPSNFLDLVEPGRYLNDVVINFFLEFFHTLFLNANKKNKVSLVSTFLYPQLVKVDQYNDDKIKRFLKRKITPTTQYLLIPINLESHQHWSLAIIANLNLQVPSDSSILESTTTSILYLDSIMKILPETKQALNRCVRIAHELLSLSPPTLPPPLEPCLEKFLQGKQGDQLFTMKSEEEPNYPLYNHRMQVPQQKNGYDCGIFLIEFVARFLLEPQSLINNKKS